MTRVNGTPVSARSIRRMGRDEVILEAAQKLFFERSFDRVGVDEIGQAAGVSGSAIYRHFEGKDEILSVLFDRAIDALLLGLTTPKDDPRQELAALVDSFVQFAQANRTLAGIWEREHRSLTGAYKRRYQRRRRQYVDRWTACLEQCYPGWTDDQLRVAIRAVQALMMSNATRTEGSSSPKIGLLLTAMALSSLDSLERPA